MKTALNPKETTWNMYLWFYPMDSKLGSPGKHRCCVQKNWPHSTCHSKDQLILIRIRCKIQKGKKSTRSKLPLMITKGANPSKTNISNCPFLWCMRFLNAGANVLYLHIRWPFTVVRRGRNARQTLSQVILEKNPCGSWKSWKQHVTANHEIYPCISTCKGVHACVERICSGGHPWWSIVENFLPSAGGHGFYPWSLGRSHMPWDLSPSTTTTEHVLQSLGAATLKPMCLEPRLCNLRSHRSEKSTHHNAKSSPPLAATKESPHAATAIQCRQN